MEKTLRIAGIGMNNHFVEDSPQSIRPQASSTFMLSRTDFDLKDVGEVNGFQSPKQGSTSAFSTTSSLGVIDLEKHSLFSEKDESISKRLQDTKRQSKSLIEEQRSLSVSRFKQRLDDISMTNDFNFEVQKENIERSSNNFVQSTTNENLTYAKKDGNSLKTSRLSFPGNTSNTSSPVFDTCFESGKAAVMKLDADQKQNRQEFGSLPVSPTNISVNSENFEDKEKKFAEFVKDKCYSPEEISNVLRNKLNLDLKDNVKRSISESTTTSLSANFITAVKQTNDSYFPSKIPIPSSNGEKINHFKIPSPKKNEMEFKYAQHISKPEIKSCFPNYDVKSSPADSTVFHDTFEESRASSIASINQIAEALRRKSLMAEPKLAIEHLLSIGKSKSKFNPSVTPSSNQSAGSVPNTCSSAGTVVTAVPQNDTEKSGLNTPSTLMCSAHDLSVDSMTGKVRSKNVLHNTTFTTARKFLESLNRKPSNISEEMAPIRNQSVAEKYFSLVKTISLLDTSDCTDQTSDTREFWKLNPPTEASEPDAISNGLDSTEYLVEAYRKKIQELTQNAQRLLKSDNLKINGATEPVQRISLSQNLTRVDESILTDGLDGDVIKTGTLCIGTQVEVIIAIENPSEEALKYKMTLKSILVNGEINLSAVSVMLVSNYPDIILLPKTENEIKIMLSPLVPGKIDVVLELVSDEKKFLNITRRIRISGEKPKLRLSFPEKPEINFDLLAEGTTKNISLQLTNEGCGRLPLKLFIHEGNRTTFFARTVIEPLNEFECDVRVTTLEISKDSPDITKISGELIIQLDTSEESLLGPLITLQTLSLMAAIGRTNLEINDCVPIVLNCSSLLKHADHHFPVTNTGVVPIDVTVQLIEPSKSEFTIEPHIFKLLPLNTRTLKLTFKPLRNERRRDIEINFIINGTNKMFSTQITGTVEIDNVSSSVITPRKNTANNCITPQSSSSSNSSTGADGPMELDSTHSSVSWSSVPLHSKSIQNIIIRNRSAQREKLLLTISDSSGAFKFIENELYFRDLKLTLEPKESRKISITFMPFVADQAANGRIVIIRRHSLEASVGELQKRVIPLYGIGGKVKIAFSGVFHDNENRLWITPESDSFETKFTIENAGDSVAFVKIVSEDLDDVLYPEEIILLPAESAEVNYSLHLTKDRLDSLYKQNPSKEVLLVNKITVYSGCESTRLRLKKLWVKFKEFENIQRIRDKVELLMDMNSQGKVLVDCLSDSPSTLNTIWYEGIAEQVIGVLVPQQYLESACLDSTVVFKDLADVTSSVVK